MTYLYQMHLLFMIFSFIVFSASFVSGFFFLLQEKDLKNHQLTLLVKRLPALEKMNSLHYKFLTTGFFLLSFGILSGAFLSKASQGSFFSTDPRQMASLAIWALYALLLNVRFRAGWRGRKGILLSLLGFVGIILTFIGIQHRM